jgi:hypothetical protein
MGLAAGPNPLQGTAAHHSENWYDLSGLGGSAAIRWYNGTYHYNVRVDKILSISDRLGCFRPSDRLAARDSHPLKIADIHGVLSF